MRHLRLKTVAEQPITMRIDTPLNYPNPTTSNPLRLSASAVSLSWGATPSVFTLRSLGLCGEPKPVAEQLYLTLLFSLSDPPTVLNALLCPLLNR
jgi:hypothetical protein